MKNKNVIPFPQKSEREEFLLLNHHHWIWIALFWGMLVVLSIIYLVYIAD